MSRVVWKFPVSESVIMPRNGRIVHHSAKVKTEDGPAGVVWVECDPQATMVSREFKVVGTGAAVPDKATHVNTWMEGPFVWHLYALPEES